MDTWLLNEDHGLPHAGRVWSRALNIIQGSSSNALMHRQIEEGCAFHDSARWRKEAKGELNIHSIMGIKLYIKWVENYTEQVSTGHVLSVCSAIANHDYFGDHMSGNRIAMPQMFVDQVVCCADKTSLEPDAEVDRFWFYGKSMGEEFYKPQDDMDDEIYFRINWTPIQRNDLRSDQVCWFSLIFALRPKDFINPWVRAYYIEWETKKQKAVDRIIELAQKECPQYVDRIKMIIETYKTYLGLKW